MHLLRKYTQAHPQRSAVGFQRTFRLLATSCSLSDLSVAGGQVPPFRHRLATTLVSYINVALPHFALLSFWAEPRMVIPRDHTSPGAVANPPEVRDLGNLSLVGQIDTELYHVGLGAGADPMDPRELRYQIDNNPQVLPTFGNVAASFHHTEPPTVQFPGIDIELSKVLRASEAVTVPAPLQASGSARSVTRFTEVWDKAAVIVSQTTVTDPEGRLDDEAIDLRSRRGRLRPASADRRHRWSRRTAHPMSRCRCRSRAGAAVSAVRGPQSAALRSGICRSSGLSASDPARPVHLHGVQGERRQIYGQP